MSNDFSADLLKNVKRSFDNNVKANAKISAFNKRVRDGTAKLADVQDYAGALGECLSAAFSAVLTEDLLQETGLYYTTAAKVVKPMVSEAYRKVQKQAQTVQKAVDKKKGIQLDPRAAPVPDERIDSLVGAMSIADKDKLQQLFGEPVANITRASVDDFVATNAQYREASGLNVTIQREVSGGACSYCMMLAGDYESYSKAPKNVFARHTGCACVITYDSSKGSVSRQYVSDRSSIISRLR